jgi:putative ABC transport system permease protein
VLAAPGDVLVTRDLAQENGLSVGQELLLSDLSAGVPLRVTVRGIVTRTPDQTGSRIYYRFDTARALAGARDIFNSVLLLTDTPEAVGQALTPGAWYTYPAEMIAANNRRASEMFDIGLKGAGILGLLVGGIGIANTMQVLLRRRQRELAVFKTLGYTTGSLVTLFVLEAVLLGLAGSVIGLLMAAACGYWLTGLFSRLTNLLINTQFLAGGMWIRLLTAGLVGVVTTVIFALYAILGASRVSPVSILRGEVGLPAGRRRLQSAGLLAALAVPFAAITILVMGSFIKGLGVLLFALAGLVVLGGLLAGAAWLVARLLPVRSFPLLNMARNSFQRRGAGLVFAMIALFAGVVSLGLAAVVIQGAERENSAHTVNAAGFNLAVVTSFQAQTETLAAVGAFQAYRQALGYETRVTQIESTDNPAGDTISPVLIARSEPHDFKIRGAAWGSVPGVYTYAESSIPAGSRVQVTLRDGRQVTLDVIGTYMPTLMSTVFRFESGLLLPAAASLDITPPDSLSVFLQVPAGQVDAVSARLGAALPASTVVNLSAYAARLSQTYRNLFLFAISLAGLALLAGAVLIANSATLGILERRYELGVLKAVGYNRRQLLLTLGIEYLIASLIASLVGLLAIWLFLAILSGLNVLAGSILRLDPLSAALIALSSAGLTLLTVLWAAWRPVQVSPVVVLNNQN